MTNKLLDHFKNTVRPAVIDMLERNTEMTQQTMLAVYMTDAISNAMWKDNVFFDNTQNDIEHMLLLEVEGDLPNNYIQFALFQEVLEDMLTSFSSYIASIKNNTELTPRQVEVLKECIEACTTLSTNVISWDNPESKRFADMVEQLKKFTVTAENLSALYDLVNDMQVTLWRAYYSELGEWKELCTIYFLIAHNEYIHYTPYNTEPYFELKSRTIDKLFVSALAPDIAQRIEPFINFFLTFRSGIVFDITKNIELLKTQPDLFTFLSFDTFVRPFYTSYHLATVLQDYYDGVTQKLVNWAQYIDDIDIRNNVLNAIQADKQAQDYAAYVSLCYGTLIPNINYDNQGFLSKIMSAYINWMYLESRYITNLYGVNIDIPDGNFIDKTKVLKAVAKYGTFDDEYSTLIMSDDLSTYLKTFLGSYNDLYNKIMSKAINTGSLERQLLHAIAATYQDDSLTEEERIVLERLIPKRIYIDYLMHASSHPEIMSVFGQ